MALDLARDRSEWRHVNARWNAPLIEKSGETAGAAVSVGGTVEAVVNQRVSECPVAVLTGAFWFFVHGMRAKSPNDRKLSDGGRKDELKRTDALPPFAGARG